MSGDKIMSLVEESHASDSEIEIIKMTTVDNAGNTQNRKILSCIKRDPTGNYNYMIRFLEPEEIRGVSLLTKEQPAGEAEQYLYLPALGEVRRIQGNQKSKPFMGTDFTFEDLRKERSTEYMYHRMLDMQLDGRECYVLLSAPADEFKQEATGFSTRRIFVEKDTLNILKIEFYDENDELLKTLQGFDYDSAQIDGPSKRPRRAVMTNHEKGTSSIMVLLKSRLGYELDPALFEPETLEQWTEEHDAMMMSVFEQAQPKTVAQ